MSQQLHKRFTTDEVVAILERYLNQEIDIAITLRLLKLQRRQFFKLLKQYREAPNTFSINYTRTQATHRIDEKVEQLLHKELAKEKQLINNKDTPIKFYNYSYIQQRLLEKQGIQVSLPTIIDRAKKMIITSQRLKRKVTTARY